MAKRTIGTGVGTYLRPDGVWHFGCLGEQVDVHDSDLERFDRLNSPAGPIVDVVEVVPPAIISTPDAAPETAGDIPQMVEVAKPARMASKATWVEYAVAQGMSQEEAEADTRDVLVEKFGG